MARGKQSLAELTAPENIIETNEEVGSVPFYLIDDNYGISGCYADYALVIKKRANKTGKEENGEDPTKVYSYYRWDELKYSGTIAGIYDIYLKVNKINAFKNLKTTKDINKLLDIENGLHDYIHSKLDIIEDKKFEEMCNLTDTVLFLKQQITEAKAVLSDYKRLIADTEKEFKEAKKIIVENTPKHKKHKVQEETE